LFADWLKPAGAEKVCAERAWIVANHDRIVTALVDHGQL